MADRTKLLNYGLVNVAYRSLPTGTSFTVQKKVNTDAAFSTAISGKVDAKRMLFATAVDINDAVRAQVKVNFVASANTAPEMEMAEVNVDA